MAENQTVNAAQEMRNARYDSFPQIFGKMRELSAQYANLPMDSLLDAFGTVISPYNALFTENPTMA